MIRDLTEYFRDGWSDPEPEVRPFEDYVEYWRDHPMTEGWAEERLLNFAGVCHWARYDPWSED